jgi:hypothetical protein
MWRKILENDNNIWANYLLSNVAYVLLTSITYYDGLNKEDKKSFLSILNSEIVILKYSKDSKGKAVYMVTKLIGLKCTSYLISYLRSIKQNIS